MDENKIYRCKFGGCKVEVISPTDLRPKHLGSEHTRHCPRRNKSDSQLIIKRGKSHG